jgi:hypothetical protein
MKGDDVKSEEHDPFERLVKTLELLKVVRMATQTRGNALVRPAEHRAGFDGHQPVGDFGENMRRGPTFDLLAFQAFQKRGSGGSVTGIRDEVIDEGIRVEKNSSPRGEISKRHGLSHGWLSGPTKYSRAFASPFQGIKPALWRIGMGSGLTLTVTRSFSPSGNGLSGFNTPFS